MCLNKFSYHLQVFLIDLSLLFTAMQKKNVINENKVYSYNKMFLKIKVKD